MDPDWLDGNAVAGELQAAFGSDMTTVERRCRSCGEQHAVGAHRAYRGAGLVLRCPGCGDLAALVVRTDERHVVTLSGAYLMQSSPRGTSRPRAARTPR